ncbi:glycosyltransferase family 33 protein [Irpex rosettiformis]|uniref:Glycosyltransferase family 33 protein n=1 Tax=Irpex rosettiformis TaxID=378272 RepID=A0ACB8U6J6_9APHY|nr:glycosyltransferase family 33 protein [Irpex rosettiformis]
MDKTLIISFTLGILVLLLVFRVISASRQPVLLRSVAVVVLGDVGRSPRMMYHAESFATNGFNTYIIGNKGTTPIPSLLSLPRVRFCYLPDPPRTIKGTPFLIAAPRKVVLQVFYILEALLVRVPNPPEFIIVQNPPSIPTLALVWLVGRFRGSKVIIDWHNLGYSILALKLGSGHPLVRVAECFEGFFGRSAYAHLFVTRAMRDQLDSKWSLRGKKIVLHDRPPAHFHRASESEMHDLFLRILSSTSSPSVPAFSNLSSPSLEGWLPSYDPPQTTPFTRILPHLSLTSSESQPSTAQRDDRPALVVSSTSWTPDEDFGILLDGLSKYDKIAKGNNGKLPKVLMIVTGKGPDRARWLRKVDALQGNDADEKDRWTHVRLLSMWLEAADYPLLLGSADLGISLHSSSSGIDLPMKVVDMFGCGLPVCALNFACLDELVKDGVNGLVFNNADQLAAQLESLLTNFPSSPTLSSLRASLQQDKHADAARQGRGDGGQDGEWEWCTWSQNWDRVMKPILLSDLSVDRE